MRTSDRSSTRPVRRVAGVAASVVLVTAVLSACSDDGASEAQSFTGDGLVERAEIAAGPNSTLSAELTIETTEPVTTSVVATADDRAVEVRSPSEPSRSQTIPVVGLRAETTYDVEVVAEDDSGETETVDLSFRTGELPDHLPPLTVQASEPERMEPGVTMFNVRYWGPPRGSDLEVEPPGELGYILAVDEEGEIVWYYRTPLEVTDVSRTPRGTLLLSMHDVLIREIDLLGNTVRELGSRVATEYVRVDLQGHEYVSDATEPIAIDSSHHELHELPNGHLLTISTELIELPDGAGAALCPDDPPERVVGDIVVELDADGSVVEQWPLSDYFDPVQRPGAEMCTPPPPLAPPNWFYPQGGDARDWTHANSAVIDERTNTLIVSIRHLDAVIGIRYRDDASGPAGELVWELSENGTLSMVGDGEWPRHQHAAEPADDGTILIYDNGNDRPGTASVGGDEPTYSRAVRYRIDEERGTVEQVWEHRDLSADGIPIYAPYLSEADELPNGNVLVTHGAGSTPDGFQYARLVEVVPDVEDGDDEIVFDLVVGDRETVSWSVYRSERLPSMYFGSNG